MLAKVREINELRSLTDQLKEDMAQMEESLKIEKE